MELKTIGLTKKFASKTAVDDLNITLTNGVYGLLGANGAGKTTLMRLLCNIQNPTSGKILLNGKSIAGLGERYRNLLGYLPQHFGYYPDFSAFDFLLYISALAAQRGRFPLCDAVQRYINFLSKDNVSEEDLKVDKVRRTADASLRSTKAKIAQLELQELQGKMHSSDDVEAITSDMIFSIRGALIALPGRLAVDVVRVKTPAEVAELIRKEVHKIMRELSNYRYDPQKYEERVRERKDWETSGRDIDDD